VFITARAYFVNVRAGYCTFPTDLRIIADGIMAGSFAIRQSKTL
jgi:hypothetical protein